MRCAKCNVRAHSAEPPQVRASHAAMQNIADDHHLQTLDSPKLLVDCKEIEQCLSRVSVTAVTSVEHGAAKVLRNKIRRAAFLVAHDDNVGAERLERAHGVEQRLT